MKTLYSYYSYWFSTACVDNKITIVLSFQAVIVNDVALYELILAAIIHALFSKLFFYLEVDYLELYLA